MSILSFISDIFKPVADLVDEVHVSDEERLRLRNQFAEIQNSVNIKMIELQSKALDASSKVAEAETKSDSAFTRLYRPMIITGMFLLLCANAFGFLAVPLPDVFVTIFGTTFGVVGLGRTFEKVKK